MSDDAHVSVAVWPVVKVYRGWGINPKRGLGIEGSVFFFFYTNTESFRQICVNIFISDFYPSVFDGVCAFLGRSICASGTGEPGRVIRSPLSFLRSRHAHALHCWKGVSLGASVKPPDNIRTTYKVSGRFFIAPVRVTET